MNARTLLACGTSVLLYPLALHSVGPLVAIALTPALVTFTLLKRSRDLAILSLVTGMLSAFFVQHTLWVASFTGTVVLSVYQGMIWVPMAFAVRYSRRRWQIPSAVSWPFIWCAGEILRSLGPLGTLFGTLAVPETTSLWMLQIVDLGGASIAAFPLAALQGWFGDLYLAREQRSESNHGLVRRICRSGMKISTAFLVLTWGFVGGYGHMRLAQVDRITETGPEIGVVATDVLALPDGEVAYDGSLLLEKLKGLSEALVEKAPEVELIVWPEGLLGTSVPNRAFFETAFESRMAGGIASRTGLAPTDAALKTRWDQMQEAAEAREAQFRSWIEGLGVSVLVGMDAWVPAPPDLAEPFLLKNSAVLFSPGAGQSERAQEKVRLYPLGEYLPLKNSFAEPLVRAALGEPKADYHPGTERHRYAFGEEGAQYAVALCSELKFDHLRGLNSGEDTAGKPYEMLVNMANEGLFHRNGMPGIFAFCATLRAIENRVTVVRSSNSGVTGFWGPTGKSYGTVTNRVGRVQSGMGAAELPAVAEVMRFRKQYGAELLADPSRREELSCLVADVERIRSEAAVEGYSSQQVCWVPGETVFNRYGDSVKLVLVGMLVLSNLMEGVRRIPFSKGAYVAV